jgi:hypothetical protein
MPVDFHLFAATISTAATGYAEFLQTTLDLLPPPITFSIQHWVRGQCAPRSALR